MSRNKPNFFHEENLNYLEWDNFLLKTENLNFFSNSVFLKNSKFQHKKIMIKKGNEVIASFHLFFNKKKIILGDSIYTSINFRKNIDKNRPSNLYEKFLILDYFKDYILENFTSGDFILDYSVKDLRPFMRHNFLKRKKVFVIEEVKYTSLVNLKEFKDMTFFSRSNKQQYKNAQKKNFIIEENFDLDFMYEVYSKTFQRQNIKINNDFDNYIKNITELYKTGACKMYICKKENTKLSYCLYGIMNERAIYINGGRLKKNNDDYSLTFNLISSCNKLNDSGVQIVDLEGINTPSRGFWKLGFGGNIKPYYRLSFNNL